MLVLCVLCEDKPKLFAKPGKEAGRPGVSAWVEKNKEFNIQQKSFAPGNPGSAQPTPKLTMPTQEYLAIEN